MVSNAGDSPGCPRVEYISANGPEVKSVSANSAPNASRTRISSVPRGWTFRANSAVACGISPTGGTGRNTGNSLCDNALNVKQDRPSLCHKTSHRLRQRNQGLILLAKVVCAAQDAAKPWAVLRLWL